MRRQLTSDDSYSNDLFQTIRFSGENPDPVRKDAYIIKIDDVTPLFLGKAEVWESTDMVNSTVGGQFCPPPPPGIGW